MHENRTDNGILKVTKVTFYSFSYWCLVTWFSRTCIQHSDRPRSQISECKMINDRKRSRCSLAFQFFVNIRSIYGWHYVKFLFEIIACKILKYTLNCSTSGMRFGWRYMIILPMQHFTVFNSMNLFENPNFSPLTYLWVSRWSFFTWVHFCLSPSLLYCCIWGFFET